jgi:hypothetical protein
LYQFAQGYRLRWPAAGFCGWVFFGEDVVAVVEVVELLGELEDVAGDVGGLGCGDALGED